MNPSREEALFELALAKPTEERSVLLARACGDDFALRRRVEALLAAHEQASGFLPSQTTGGDAATVLDASKVNLPVHTPDEREGSMLGRYKVIEKLGEGGFGSVWLAEQKEPVRRKVALKIIKLGMDTKQVVARFEAERQALALMEHPNIAKVLDAGATDNGRPYFVMELVRGIPITKFCDENRTTTKDRLDLFIKVCQAIQHAHQKGIIHRDIKPSNVMVTLHDGVPVPKVIDFGIAKATQGELTDKTIHTQFQQFIGTPAYMSPEQAEMSGLDIDTRSDIYSLGVLLYELLTGNTPFDGKELIASGLDAMRKTIREKEPVRPSTRLSQSLVAADVRRLQSSAAGEITSEENVRASSRRLVQIKETIALLRGDLDWIVMKCLEKDRVRRYETANGLATDLKRHLNNEPVLARPPSAAYKFQKAWRRNKLAFAAGAIVALTLLMGITATSWQAKVATHSRNEARSSEQASQRARATAEEQSHRAEQQRLRAEAQELAARRSAYASGINLAQQSLAANILGKSRHLLNELRPGSPADPDLRGWEWRYLWQQCRSEELFTLCRQTSVIRSLAVSPDGRWLAVGANGRGLLSIWDVRTRGEIERPAAGNGSVLGAFAPNQPWLAFSEEFRSKSSNSTYAVEIRDISAHRTITTLPLDGACAGLAFSQDGKTLVTSTYAPDDQITLWSVPDGKRLLSHSAKQISNVQGSTFAVALDASLAAHGTPGGRVRMIDLQSGKELWCKTTSNDLDMQALALSPDHQILATSAGFSDPEIRLLDALSGRELSRLEGHRSYSLSLAFSADGKTLASASADQTLRLWDVSDPTRPKPKDVLRGHQNEVWSVAWIPETELLVSGCKDGTVSVWDMARREHLRGPTRLELSVLAWQFTPDSQSVIGVGQDGRVTRWSGGKFQESELITTAGTNICAAIISEDCKWLAAGTSNGIVEIWNLERRSQTRRLGGQSGPVSPWAFMAQGQRLVVGHLNDSMHDEWDLATGQKIRSWRGPNRTSYIELPFDTISRDGQWCLQLSLGAEIVLRDVRKMQEIRTNISNGSIFAGAFSPKGDLFALGNNHGAISVWRTSTLEKMVELPGFFQSVASVAYSPDGTRLAAGGDGKEAIKIWDTTSFAELLTLEGQGSFFFPTRFSPDGNWLSSANYHGVLHLWRAPSWEEIAAADAKEKAESKQP